MSNGKSVSNKLPDVRANSVAATSDFFKTNGERAVVMPGGPSLTRQEFAEECDINSIMKRYEGVGTGPGGLPRSADLPPFYADFTEVPTDLLGFMAQMDMAQTAFMSLPASVRREFDNDPVMFVDFASDPGNLEQMRTWGLAPPAKPAETPSGTTAASGAGGSKEPPAAPVGASTQGST